MSALNEAIRVAGARRTLGVRVEAGGTWGVRTPGYPGATLHAVLAGEVWLDLPGVGAQLLRAGDVMWLPPDLPHGLAGRPDAKHRACNHTAARHSVGSGIAMRLGYAPPTTRLLTLHYSHDPEVSSSAILALSAPMRLDAQDYPALSAINQLLDHELAQQQTGTTAAANSLVDLLLVHLMRALLATGGPGDPESWDGRLDPISRDAVDLIHRAPHKDWTIDSLAAATGVSRASLNRHFTAALGQAPGAYLTTWRMDLAALRLRDTDEPVLNIAHSVGYISPNAFSRAFRRHRGQTPSQYRHDSRHRASTVRDGAERVGHEDLGDWRQSEAPAGDLAAIGI
ncbi:AraC family transcriptional regulator [Nesterenkonia sp. Hz 6-5]|nr:AraC family transcriptional regulator [Nesterenkonia haasae]